MRIFRGSDLELCGSQDEQGLVFASGDTFIPGVEFARRGRQVRSANGIKVLLDGVLGKVAKGKEREQNEAGEKTDDQSQRSPGNHDRFDPRGGRMSRVGDYLEEEWERDRAEGL